MRSIFKIKIKAQDLYKGIVYGGPGSGRYPRGSGENPQASKKNPKGSSVTAYNLLEDFHNAEGNSKKQRSILRDALQANLNDLQVSGERVQKEVDTINDIADKAIKGKTVEEQYNTLSSELEKAGLRSYIGEGSTTKEKLDNTLDDLDSILRQDERFLNWNQSKIDSHPINTGSKIEDVENSNWFTGGYLELEGLEEMVKVTGGKF